MAVAQSSWSLAERARAKSAAELDLRTLAIIGRAIAHPPDWGGKPAGTLGPAEAPDIPGLVDWEFVGRGGMGVVFRAREVDLDRPVAVKVISEAARLTTSARARAVREAMLMAKLRHPNVVPVYRSGEADGSPLLVMEWVGGGTLQAMIQARQFSPKEAAETARDLALAVASGHALGIIHRDLKPDNVLIAPPSTPGARPVPKLTDFGLARREADEFVTETGFAMGTPGYMAPEQTGLAPNLGGVGPATDIHGLGAILFACLTGRPPFEAESPLETMVRSVIGEPISIREFRPDVPRDLATIAEKCLQTEPFRRYRSAGELADDLGAFLDGRPIAARPISAPERWWKWARRRPALAVSAALLLITAIGAVAGVAYHVDSIGREQVKTTRALASARLSRDQARAALGSLTDDVVQRLIQRGKALDESDRAFLRKVRGYYESWPLEPDPVAALKFRGAGLARVGSILLGVHQNEEALACLEAADAAFDDAARRGPLGPDGDERRQVMWNELHHALGSMGRAADAERVARRLIAALESAPRTNKVARCCLNITRIELAPYLLSQGRRDEAEASIRAGLAGMEALRIEYPGEIWLRRNELILVHEAAGLPASRDVRKAYLLKSIELTEDAARVFPDDPRFRFDLGEALFALIEFLKDDDPAEAYRLQRRRLDLIRDLIDRSPGDAKARSMRVWAASRTFTLCRSLGRPGDAEADLLLAVDEGAGLVRDEPAVIDRACSQASALAALGALYECTDRPQRAMEEYDRAIAVFAPWLKMTGDKPGELINPLSDAIRGSARLLARSGDHAGAARRLSTLLEIHDPAYRPAIQAEIDRELRLAETPGVP